MVRKAYGMSDIGRERAENEDSYLIEEDIGLYIVADGMGGLDRGAEASKFAVNRLSELVFTGIGGLGALDASGIRRFLSDAVNRVSQELREEVGDYSGTTLVFMLAAGSRVFVGNVGDSPAYFYRNGSLKQISKDHNVAGELYASGRISLSQLKCHPSRNRLTAYIGMDEYPPVHISELSPSPGDRILLCSDGLPSMVGDDEIEALLGKSDDAGSAVRKLIERSNSEGGLDNITAILVGFQ